MARTSPTLEAFNSGELSPNVKRRHSLDKYASGCTRMENFIPLPHGPATRRPGTYFVSEVKSSAAMVRLIKFEFSVTQAYILEVGNLYFRFYKDSGQIQSGSPLAAYELVHTYAQADLFALKFAQDADTLYITHPSYKPRKLTRSGHAAWTITDITFEDGPYLDENTAPDLGANLCPDPDMELDTGWTSIGTPAAQARSSAGTAHKGAYTRLFTVDGANEGIKSGAYTSENAIYRVSFWVYTATGKLSYSIRKGDDSGFIFTETVSSVPNNAWTKYERYYAEANAGAGAYLQITGSDATSGSWYIDDVEIYKVDTILITPSAVTGTGITLTASASLFVAGHVGAYWRLKHGTTWGYCQITAVGSATSATATVIKAFGDTDPTPSWREGAWSTKNGYPGAVMFSGQRAIFAGSTSYPHHVWCSKIGDYENMTPGTTAADAFWYEIACDAVASIRWLASVGNIIVGTVNSEYRVMGPDSTEVISQDNVDAVPKSRKGSANIQALNMGSVVLFVQRLGKPTNNGQKVIELVYKYENDAYAGNDLTILADHITKPGIVDWAFQANPHPIVWVVRSDGVLLGLTYDREQNVIGWHRHPTDGLVESVAVIPGETQDQVWLSVNRTIGGATKRYIEYMMPFEFEDQEDAFHVDCGLTYTGAVKTITGATQANPVVVTMASHGLANGTHVQIKGVLGMTELNGRVYTLANVATNTAELEHVDGTAYTAYTSGGTAQVAVDSISGLDHLEGEEVVIFADGAIYPPATVASGAISLDQPASVIHAGLNYDSLLETMDIQPGPEIGSSVGKTKKVVSMIISLSDTLGGWAGTDEDYLQPIIHRTTEDDLGAAPPLYTGDYSMDSILSEHAREARIVIKQTGPGPMTVLAITPTMEVQSS